MLAEERREEILKMLEKNKIVKAMELSKYFEVGIETIRRDFDALEKQGQLKKIYGGATLERIELKNLDYTTRLNIEVAEKTEIAQKAVKFIVEEDTIFLNDSSTNIYLAKEIKKNIRKITVITNSLVIASELSDMEDYSVILAGGFLDSKEKAFFGTISEEIISNFIVNKAFLSVSNLSLKTGFTDYPQKEVIIQKAMIKYSKEVIVLANSQKFETTALIKVAELNEAKIVITDSKLRKAIYETYKENNIDIIY
ncbi:MAG: Glucitol operon repressor [Fusobacterium varium]